ncbi:hypothetical protein Tco_1165546 [Tanacetum coccineum]
MASKTFPSQHRTTSTCLKERCCDCLPKLRGTYVSHAGYARINGEENILVIVDADSRYTMASLSFLYVPRGTEFLNKTLNAFFKEEGIEHQTSTSYEHALNRMRFDRKTKPHSRLAPPRQMTSDHNSSELGIHDHSNELSSSKLVPKVVPPVDKTATSRQELKLLFQHHITMLSRFIPHAHAQTTKTYYKHQDSRIKKAQELKTKTSANSDIKDNSSEIKLRGRLLASFQYDAKYEHVGQDTDRKVAKMIKTEG